jgi:hypothetical protein
MGAEKLTSSTNEHDGAVERVMFAALRGCRLRISPAASRKRPK